MSMRTERLNEMLRGFIARGRLESFTSFVEELQVPSELAPGLMAGRGELIRHVQPRALTIAEAAALYKVIAALVETNAALRQHAEQVGQLVDNWANAFQALHSIGDQIAYFANFKMQPEDGQ